MNIKSNLQNSLSDQRSRVFLFLMVAIIIIVLIFAYSSYNSDPTQAANAGNTPASKIKDPGANIASTPGLKNTTEEYNQLQKEFDQDKAKEALSSGGKPSSALPTLEAVSQSAIPGLDLKGTAGDSYQDRLAKQLADQQRLRDEMQRQQEAERERQRQEAEAQAMQTMYARQIGILTKNWQVTPQSYVAGAAVQYPERKSQFLLEADEVTAKNKDSKPKIYYKAGDILFGVVLTGINSDEPGPILARIISGPLANSKIIGAVNPSTIPQSGTAAKVSRSLILEFNIINIPGSKTSVPFKAVAIDPDTARTRLATSVDNHYLLRYGTFFASNFLAGLGDAISMQSQTKVVTGTGSTDIGRTSKFSSAEESKIALGNVAKEVTKSLNFMDMPPTIKIASGTAVGILLQQDLIIGEENNTDPQRLVNQSQAANGTPVANTFSIGSGAEIQQNYQVPPGYYNNTSGQSQVYEVPSSSLLQ